MTAHPVMPEGVRTLDHTADVGLEVRAPDLAGLLRRAALGMDWLLREAAPPAAVEERPVRLEAPDAPALLRALLRELLFWHEADGFAPADLRVRAVDETSVDAVAVGGRPEGSPIREIKGVTWHHLAAEPDADGWRGLVIFDV